MEESSVQILMLPPMRIASAWAYGPSPENAAWQKLEAWARPRGLFEAHGSHQPRIFGFNNPNPSAGTPNYGYEFWLTVEPAVEPEGDIRISHFAGGRYAVMPIAVKDPWQDIPEGWRRLDVWLHEHGHEMGSHQWLEEHHLTGSGNLMALCCPLGSQAR